MRSSLRILIHLSPPTVFYRVMPQTKIIFDIVHDLGADALQVNVQELKKPDPGRSELPGQLALFLGLDQAFSVSSKAY